MFLKISVRNKAQDGYENKTVRFNQSRGQYATDEEQISSYCLENRMAEVVEENEKYVPHCPGFLHKT